MPTKARAVAPRAGTASSKRKARHQAVRKPKRTEKTIGSPVPASLYSLKLPVLTGAEVFCKMSGLSAEFKSETQLKLYEDLKTALIAAARAWCPERSLSGFFEACEACSNLRCGGRGSAIKMVIAKFRELFTSGSVLMNVAEDERGNYGFHLYYTIPFDPAWYVVEVLPLLATVKKKSRALYQTTLSFLNLFVERCAIPTWYNGAFELPEMYVEDRIRDMQEEGDQFDYWEGLDKDQEYLQLLRDLNSHRTGPAAALAAQIKSSDPLSTFQIRKRLKRIRVSHPVRKALLAGCELIDMGYTTYDFSHSQEIISEGPDDEECYPSEPDGALGFRENFCLLYAYQNRLTADLEDMVNHAADEVGVVPPVIRFEVFSGNENWDRTWFDDGVLWPHKLCRLVELLNEASETKESSSSTSKSEIS